MLPGMSESRSIDPARQGRLRTCRCCIPRPAARTKVADRTQLRPAVDATTAALRRLDLGLVDGPATGMESGARVQASIVAV